MKLRHFEAIRPICAVCKQHAASDHPLAIGRVLREAPGEILEGVLLCTGCQREYPIIDGIPLLVPALRAYVAQNIFPIIRRGDLSDVTESILGDCCGPGSAFDQTRQHLSSYAFGHYSDLDPKEARGDGDGEREREGKHEREREGKHEREREGKREGEREGEAEASDRPSLLALLDAGLEMAGAPLPGPVLDAGCSVGRSTFELAGRTSELVLGVDLSFSMLQTAATVMREGVARFDLRRGGLVYERRSFEARFPRAEAVDFWACDAQSLPFPDRTFGAAVSLNLLDCMASPYDHLASLGRVLREGASAVIATPYDWSPSATPIEAWIGGHSQRGPEGGSSEAALRALLTPNAHPAAIDGLRIESEARSLPWRVRVHDRSELSYSVHLVIARAVSRVTERASAAAPSEAT